MGVYVLQLRCEECIELETADVHQIKVPILAVLPLPTVSLTDQLKFGMCALKESINVNFEVSNTGCVQY